MLLRRSGLFWWNKKLRRSKGKRWDNENGKEGGWQMKMSGWEDIPTVLHCLAQHPWDHLGQDVIRNPQTPRCLAFWRRSKRKSEIGGKVDSEIRLREVAAGLGIQGGMGPICKAINLIEFPWKLSDLGEIFSRAIKKYFFTNTPMDREHRCKTKVRALKYWFRVRFELAWCSFCPDFQISQSNDTFDNHLDPRKWVFLKTFWQ